MSDGPLDSASYGRRLVFVMLNPSTADDVVDDPTIRRCIGFARREAAPYFTVVNLFAWRATDPGDLVDSLEAGIDIVGPGNDGHIWDALADGGPVVAAWGANVEMLGSLAVRRVALVRQLVGLSGNPLMCLGTTKAGHPRHPLYLRKDTPLISYSLGGVCV